MLEAWKYDDITHAWILLHNNEQEQDKRTGWGSSTDTYIHQHRQIQHHTHMLTSHSSLSLTFQCQSSSSWLPCAAGRAECVPQRQGRCTPAWWGGSSSRTAWGSHRWQSTWQAPWCPMNTQTRWDGQSTQTGLPLHPSLNGNENGNLSMKKDSELKQAWDGCKGYCVSSRLQLRILQLSIFSSLHQVSLLTEQDYYSLEGTLHCLEHLTTLDEWHYNIL